jgi:ribosomal protein L16 Arg81 hydroxylase
MGVSRRLKFSRGLNIFQHNWSSSNRYNGILNNNNTPLQTDTMAILNNNNTPLQTDTMAILNNNNTPLQTDLKRFEHKMHAKEAFIFKL